MFFFLIKLTRTTIWLNLDGPLGIELYNKWDIISGWLIALLIFKDGVTMLWKINSSTNFRKFNLAGPDQSCWWFDSLVGRVIRRSNIKTVMRQRKSHFIPFYCRSISCFRVNQRFLFISKISQSHEKNSFHINVKIFMNSGQACAW